jgi:RNA polymerase sigma factor (sigma-70 family)
MSHTPIASALERVRTLLASQRGGVPDGRLLADFVERRDGSAFAALVHRHGALVLNVCRRTLRDAADADDAFQATFLVLARKAASIRKGESLGSWLHGVAYRVACKLRADRARRERGAVPLAETAQPDTTAEVTWREVRCVLDEELAGLPDAYRAPLVLCYLEGKTQDEAARELGWTLGALRGRLERGRDRLRARLVRRGLTLSAAVLGAALAHATPCEAATAALEVSTVKAALLSLSGAPGASAQAAALAKGVLSTMFASNLRTATLLFLGVGVLGGGGAATFFGAAPASQASVAPEAPEPKPPDEKAIRALIRQLGDDEFEKREAAQRRLVEIGEPALPQLREAARDSRDAEISQRAARLVRLIEKTIFGEVRRLGAHQGEQPWVGRVALTPDGKQAVSAGFDAVRYWDVEGGKQLRSFGYTKGSYWSLAVSKDGRRVIVGNSDQVARVFDLKTGELVQELKGHTGEVWGAALSADGKRAVTGAWDRSLRLWDVETGKELRAFDGVRENVRCLALSPDGKFVAAGHFPDFNKPGVVRLWDVEKGKEVRAFEGHTLEVSSVAFSPDGKKLLSSGFDKTVRLWDVGSGKELMQFTGHTARVESAAFTPDGKRVLSCGNEYDPTIRIWEVASGKQLLESETVEGGFLGLAVLPDGRHCVTTGKDGVVRLWRWTR